MASPDSEVVAFLQDRSAPCPRCGYELHGLERPQCPECGEPLVLKVGSPRIHFGWLLLAAAPGCFSTITAVFGLVPIIGTIANGLMPGRGVPWPLVGADIFGFISGASVFLMYRKRHALLRLPNARQAGFAAAVWAVHIFAFILLVVTMVYFPRIPPPPPPAAATAAPAPAPAGP